MPGPPLIWFTRRPSRWSVLVPLVALGAGLLFTTSAFTAQGTDLRSSSADLPGLIREQTRRNTEAAARLASLRAEVERLAAAEAPGNRQVSRLTAQAEQIAAEAGTQAVMGPALTVALTDAKISSDQLPPGVTVDDVVVHQQDVEAVVNALWAGGAEAMTVMDQRIISTSAVRCVGNTLILQGRVYSPPYLISAMGNVEDLQRALDASPGVAVYRQYVAELGLGYEVTTTPETTFPAYAGAVRLDHAAALR